MIAAATAHEWLPGPVRGTLPLSQEELEQLYAFNVELTEQDVAELSQPLPYRGDVLKPEQFKALVAEREPVGSGRKLLARVDHDTEAFHRRLAAVADLCGSSPAPVVVALRGAVFNLSAGAYEEAYRRLLELSEKRDAYRMRNALLSRLALAAPAWAAAIASRQGVHGGGAVPGDAAKAWQWRQNQQHEQHL